MEAFEESIVKYFRSGCRYKEIVGLLEKRDGIRGISLPMLKRFLKKRNLHRKINFSPISDIVEFVKAELEKSGSLVGYKWMHLKLLENGFVVRQNTVRLTLLEVDPDGVERRRKKTVIRRTYYSKGPGFLFHLDGYDKIKPYGLAISGCIDGYSRRIIWLQVGSTNNDPSVIAGYYLKAVKKLGARPLTVRTDLGTENGTLQRMQKLLKEKYSDSERPAVLTGKSTQNQKIESWWAILRKQNTQFYMEFFNAMKQNGVFTGNCLDKNLIRFCFTDIVQAELDEVKRLWNSHLIRKSKMSRLPGGRPIYIFYAAEDLGATNCMIPVDEDDVNNLMEECTFLNLPCDRNIFELCQVIMEEKSLMMETDPYRALELYIQLRKEIHSFLM